jgi:hypothetical protein
LDKTQAAIEGEWRRREDEEDIVGKEMRVEGNDTSEKHAEIEGTGQTLGTTCENTSSVEVRANATRPLLICWGGTCDSGHHQGTSQTDDNGYKD